MLFRSEVGILSAALVLIRRLAQVTMVVRVKHEDAGDAPAGVSVYEARGALFFGAADTLEILSRAHIEGQKIAILDLDHVIYMDSTAASTLESVLFDLYGRGIMLLVCNAHPQPASLMRRAGLIDAMGPHSLHADRASALARARELLAAKN